MGVYTHHDLLGVHHGRPLLGEALSTHLCIFIDQLYHIPRQMPIWYQSRVTFKLFISILEYLLLATYISHCI